MIPNKSINLTRIKRVLKSDSASVAGYFTIRRYR